MSQNPSPARPPDLTHEGAARPVSSPSSGGDSSAQIWKFIALALGVVLLAIVLFSFYPGPAPEQDQAQDEQQQQQADERQLEEEEEEAAQEKPAPTPPPPPVSDDPRPSSRSSGRSNPPEAPSTPPALANVRVLSVGYSTLATRRVVALRIGGGLPYFLREGDTIGGMNILAILTDRVQISQGGKTYEIVVAE